MLLQDMVNLRIVVVVIHGMVKRRQFPLEPHPKKRLSVYSRITKMGLSFLQLELLDKCRDLEI